MIKLHLPVKVVLRKESEDIALWQSSFTHVTSLGSVALSRVCFYCKCLS